MNRYQHDDLDMDSYRERNGSELTEDVFESVSNKMLSDCILKLPEMYRDILYLYHLYGYSFHELSIILSISVETAKKRAQRARHMLKTLLEMEGYYHE